MLCAAVLAIYISGPYIAPAATAHVITLTLTLTYTLPQTLLALLTLSVLRCMSRVRKCSTLFFYNLQHDTTKLSENEMVYDEV